MKRLLLCIILISLIMNGCGADMALNKGQEKLDLSAQSVVLATVRISNQYRPDFQPELLLARFDANSKYAEGATFSLQDGLHKSEEKKYNEYLLSFGLKPGSYNFSKIHCRCYRLMSPAVNATCEIPINSNVDIKPNSIIYLGNINAIIRERKDNEERAGSIFPLLDQWATGFSTGTFDINFTDKYDEDIAQFRIDYPAIKAIKVDKAILSPWIRPENIKK